VTTSGEIFARQGAAQGGKGLAGRGAQQLLLSARAQVV